MYNKLWQMMLEFKASGKSVLTADYDIQVAMDKTGGNHSLNKFCADISMTSSHTDTWSSGECLQ